MAEKREVNFNETLKLPNESDDSEKQNDELVEDEKETQPEESETSEEESTVVPEKEPKPVEGETPREKALRLEVQRIKKALRTERSSKLFSDEKPSPNISALSTEEQDLLKQYDPKEVDTFEKIIDVIAKKKGWARESDLRQNTYQSQGLEELDKWLENHTEYLPENDKDNILWSRFQQEFSQYKLPNKTKDLTKIFDKVHREVFGISEGTDNKQINAQKEKIKVASHGGTAPGSPKSNKRESSSVDPSLSDKLIGFTEEEKKEILGG